MKLKYMAMMGNFEVMYGNINVAGVCNRMGQTPTDFVSYINVRQMCA
jgi:hypothetical protein